MTNRLLRHERALSRSYAEFTFLAANTFNRSVAGWNYVVSVNASGTGCTLSPTEPKLILLEESLSADFDRQIARVLFAKEYLRARAIRPNLT